MWNFVKRFFFNCLHCCHRFHQNLFAFDYTWNKKGGSCEANIRDPSHEYPKQVHNPEENNKLKVEKLNQVK